MAAIYRKVLGDEQEHAMVRHEAAEALGAIADPGSLHLLTQHCSDPEPIVADSCKVCRSPSRQLHLVSVAILQQHWLMTAGAWTLKHPFEAGCPRKFMNVEPSALTVCFYRLLTVAHVSEHLSGELALALCPMPRSSKVPRHCMKPVSAMAQPLNSHLFQSA